MQRVLLSLDEADPSSIQLAIDNFALRAGEYQWLLDYIEYLGPGVQLMPNFAYAQPLAQLFLNKTQNIKDARKQVQLVRLAKAILLYPGKF